MRGRARQEGTGAAWTDRLRSARFRRSRARFWSDPGRDRGDRDPGKEPRQRTAVDIGGFVERARHYGDETFDDPDRDGDVEQAVGAGGLDRGATRSTVANRMKIGRDSTTGGATATAAPGFVIFRLGRAHLPGVRGVRAGCASSHTLSSI